MKLNLYLMVVGILKISDPFMYLNSIKDCETDQRGT